ncbi:MAG TPA: CoA transferase, partial [Streptosporangiales bacterium]
AAVGVPCGPVNDIGGGVELAASLGLAPIVELAGRRQVASPLRLSGTPVAYRRPPPGPDEDGDAVRRWLRGEGPLG